MTMRDEQKRIVRWMQSVMAVRELNAAQWAKRAGLAPTTVTRAMNPDYSSISSVQTLVTLAAAADLPSVLDFLDSQPKSRCAALPADQWERVTRMVIQRSLDVDDARAGELARLLAMVTGSLQPGDSPETERRLIDLALTII